MRQATTADPTSGGAWNRRVEQVSVIMVKAIVVAAAAVPTVLLVVGAVILAICMPILTTKRQRAARDAIAALTRLAQVIHNNETGTPR
jgi:hypothetical protein